MAYPPLSVAQGAAGPLLLRGWDRVTIGGFVLPGKAKLSKGGIKLKEDPKNKAGAHGAKPTTHGLAPQEIEVKVVVWTDEQLTELDRICQQILPVPGRDQRALSFDAAAVRPLQIVSSVLVLGASLLVDSSEVHGGKELTLYLRHWLPERRTNAHPATYTATRSTRNVRREDAERRAATAANAPRPPSTDPSTLAP